MSDDNRITDVVDNESLLESVFERQDVDACTRYDDVVPPLNSGISQEFVNSTELDDISVETNFDNIPSSSSMHSENNIVDVNDVDVGEDDYGNKLWIPTVPDQFKPKVGDQFSFVIDAEAIYRKYADKAGFDVRLKAKKKNKYGSIQTRWIVCSKEGFPKKKNFDSLEISLEIRPGDRRVRNSNVKHSGCNACLKLHLTKDKSRYEVYDFSETHNHVLFNDNDRHFSRKNRKMQYTDCRNVLYSANYKVGATRAHRIQTALKGGVENVHCTVVDYQNFKRDVDVFVGNKDAKMFINKLINRKECKKDFFFEYKCHERELHEIFWADEVAQINYRHFGDVISFDATYRTNEHALAFVPFLAVDNHQSSVVVGSVLIAGETVENFKWVLRAFLRCYEKQPLVVITDQCSAMKQVVPFVFTESRHRLYMWHIMKKVPSKVSAALNHDPEFNRFINKIVWKVNINPDDFERLWHTMIVKFNLVDDPWFTEMFEIRSSWIPAFYMDTPMSGLMKITSRSENANAFFNIYVAFHSDLVRFLGKYDCAIEAQREKQYENEHLTRTTYPQLVSAFPIERYAAKLYTRNLFFEFQKELKKAMLACGVEAVESVGDTKTFIISHNSKMAAGKIFYKVVRSSSNNTVDCECKFFVRNGFLCRHALKVLMNGHVNSIPEQYIVRRWLPELVPVQLQTAKVRYGEVDPEKEELIHGAYSKMDEIISRVRNEKPWLSRLSKMLDELKEEIDSQLELEDTGKQKIDAINEYLGVPVPEEVDIFTPTGLRNKGCGTGKRLVGISERIQSQSKKPKRKCKKCGQSTGHDSRNCPVDHRL